MMLLLIDALIFFGAAELGLAIRFMGLSDSAVETTIPKALTFTLVMLYVFYLAELYNYHKRAIVSRRVSFAFIFGLMPLTAIFYFIPGLSIGRGWFMLSYGMAYILILLWRRAAEPLLAKFRPHEKILIVGTGSAALDAVDILQEAAEHISDIEGFVAIQGNQQLVPKEKILPVDTNVALFAVEHGIDRVVIAADDRRGALPVNELLECKMAGIDVLDVPTLSEAFKSKICLNIHPSSMIFAAGFKRTMTAKAIKSSVDMLLSSLLLVLASPFFLIIPILIKLDSRGPVIFRQTRVGEYGKDFEIMKFRTMRTDAEASGPKWAGKNDSRVTRLGKFMRVTRLDELPQLLNVLKGDMSFVGPRPERPHFVDRLKDAIPYYTQRHVVKPGITGWAQIKYPYGASVEDAAEKLQYDLYYIKHLSLFLDTFIIFETVKSVLTGRGAR
ncbi:MAG: TIGR03013 family PEP-CTERM/XrtA system glycosyltransferase [Nitrospirae bacterium]|nr:TIGR03013 family PEP-CTERM/XrtA system glycosyltransferase [Nitrospirota bacterium]